MEQTATTCTLPLQRKSMDIFVCMLIVSMLLHAAMSIFFLVPAQSPVQGRQPLYVDLATIAPPVAPAKALRVIDPEPAVEPETAPVEQRAEPLSQADTLEKSVSETLQEAAGKPEVVHRSSIGLGMTSGYFGSFAEGVTLKDDIREYYFTLMRRINEVWWTRSASNPAIRGGSFILVVSRDGKVVACDPIQSTGDPGSDQMLRETVKLAEPLPPLPASFRDRNFNAPIRFVPPLNLMMPGSLLKPAAGHG